MPSYLYSCQCGIEFEAKKPMDDHTIAICPRCGKQAQWRPSDFSFTFGWRLTRKEEFDKLGKDDLVRNI